MLQEARQKEVLRTKSQPPPSKSDSVTDAPAPKSNGPSAKIPVKKDAKSIGLKNKLGSEDGKKIIDASKLLSPPLASGKAAKTDGRLSPSQQKLKELKTGKVVKRAASDVKGDDVNGPDILGDSQQTTPCDEIEKERKAKRI